MSRVSKLVTFSLRSAVRHSRSWKVMPTSMTTRMATSGRNSYNSDANIISLIKEDHSKIKKLFEQFEKASDKAQREEAVRLAIRELCLHNSKEEMVLYDNLRKNQLLSNGKELAKYNWQEHEEAKKLLYELDMKLKPTDPKYISTFEKVMKDVKDHIIDEEQNILPALEKNCDKQKLIDLGKSYINHEYIAPTRPHPSVPDKGILGKMANAYVKPIDEIRDILNPPGSSKNNSNTEKGYSNTEKGYSNTEKDYSSNEKGHSNTEKDYSNTKKDYSNTEKNFSSEKTENKSEADSYKNATYRSSSH